MKVTFTGGINFGLASGYGTCGIRVLESAADSVACVLRSRRAKYPCTWPSPRPIHRIPVARVYPTAHPLFTRAIYPQFRRGIASDQRGPKRSGGQSRRNGRPCTWSRVRVYIGRQMLGYLEKGIQTHMAQGRSTKTISMIKWIQISRLSIKNSVSSGFTGVPRS